MYRDLRAGAPQTGDHRGALLLAAATIFILTGFVPYGQLVLYPFTLLSTWVHEMGHGITALLCGGRFDELIINRDASGLARIAVVKGWRQAAAGAGGLLAPPLVGALILATSRLFARGILALLSLALLVSLLLWVRTPVGWLAMAPLFLLCLLLVRYGGQAGRLFFAKLIGLLLALDTVQRMGYLFVQSGQVGGRSHPSDVAGIAAVLGGSYLLWGALLAGLSGLLLLGGLLLAFRAPRRPAPERLPPELR
jgi:hypothetical protein